MNLAKLPTWELLQKQMTWEQLSWIHGLKVLDFGSGNGDTASYFAAENEVTAIEPSKEMLNERNEENAYHQICGSLDALKKMEKEAFDVILCHNVFEYATEREEVMKEFARILKKGGTLSILKHNKPGRVMQMVVLLNNFKHAEELLEGDDGNSAVFGSIHYYDDEELLTWSDSFHIKEIFGMRTFWDLQQNQEIQKDEAWRKEILQLEQKVSTIEEYRQIAFFHHVILEKVR